MLIIKCHNCGVLFKQSINTSDINICPHCKSSSLKMEYSENLHRNSYVLKSDTNNPTKKQQYFNSKNLPLIIGKNFTYLDYDNFDVDKSIHDFGTQLQWLKKYKNLIFVENFTNLIHYVNGPNPLILSDTAGLIGSCELIRLKTKSKLLNSTYRDFKNYLVENKILTSILLYDENSIITNLLKAVNKYVMNIIVEDDENYTEKTMKGYIKDYANEADFLKFSKSNKSSYIMDLNIFIEYKFGVCRHRNFLGGYLIAKYINEIIRTSTKDLIDIHNFTLASANLIKKIFNLRSIVRVHMELLPSRYKNVPTTASSLGGHVWCELIVTSKDFNHGYIFDSMWDKVLCVTQKEGYKSSIEPRENSDTANYDWSSVRSIIHDVQNIQSQSDMLSTNIKIQSGTNLLETINESEEENLRWEHDNSWQDEICLSLIPFADSNKKLVSLHVRSYVIQIINAVNTGDFNKTLNVILRIKKENNYINNPSDHTINDIVSFCLEILNSYT